MNIIGVLDRKENQGKGNETYLRVIKEFGDIPVLITPYNIELLSYCKGLVITGGDEKQELDDTFIQYALDNEIPLLGICQGMQSMALYQTNNQLEMVDGHYKEEGYQHEVLLKKSKLRDILSKERIMVNTYHYQIAKDSNVFSIVGYSEAGWIEAVENSSHPFQIGVEWHPERMVSYDSDSRKLFETFLYYVNKNTR